MNKRVYYKYPLLVVVLTLLCVFAWPTQADNIQRSCTANYQIYIVRAATASNVQLAPVGKWTAFGSTHLDYQFTARRGCGRSVPNRCRQRASTAALNCMQAHVRNPGSTPTACRGNGVRDYRIGNMQRLLQQSVCKFMNERSGINPTILPNPYYVDTTIRAYIHGDRGCGGGNRLHVKRDLGSVRVRCPTSP